MVAGLTADVFVQLTATLAHLSSTLNKTGGDGLYPALPPLPPPPPPNRNPYDGFRKGRKAARPDSYCRLEQNLLRTNPLFRVLSIPFYTVEIKVSHWSDVRVSGRQSLFWLGKARRRESTS